MITNTPQNSGLRLMSKTLALKARFLGHGFAPRVGRLRRPNPQLSGEPRYVLFDRVP